MSDCKEIKTTIVSPIKTWILQFIYKDGNGWAFVNAYTVNQAESIFRVQTKYEEAKVVNIKETKHYGDNMQLVFEGAVTTVCDGIANVDVARLVNEAIGNYDFTSVVEAAINAKFEDTNFEDLLDIDFNDYYTKQEVNNAITIALGRIVIPDLTNYVTNEQLEAAIGAIGEGHDGADGRDGRDGVDGQDGIGIQSITYSNGVLTITTTDNVPHSFNISIEGGGSSDSTIVEVTSIGKGPMSGTNSARARATAEPNTLFQWIQDQIVDNVRVRKLWWHVGNGVFIDALGYELDTSTL